MLALLGVPTSNRLADEETVLRTFRPCRIHLHVILFDELGDSGNFTIRQFATLGKHSRAIGLDKEFRRQIFRQLLVACMHVHGLDKTERREVQIISVDLMAIVLRHGH